MCSKVQYSSTKRRGWLKETCFIIILLFWICLIVFRREMSFDFGMSTLIFGSVDDQE